jgi:hypothetical protein
LDKIFITKPFFMPVSKHAINYGVISGLALIALFVVFHYAGIKVNWLQNLLSYGLLAVLIYSGSVKYRDEHSGGFLSYGRAVWLGFLISFICGAFISFFMYLFLSFVDPETIVKALEEAESNMIDQGLTDEQIEVGMSYARRFTTPGMIMIITIFGYVIVGTIISLLTSYFVKKDNESFENFTKYDN